MATPIDGGKTWIPAGKSTKEWLEKQSIKTLLMIIGRKSRSIPKCKKQLVGILDGVNSKF
jgi:hypothetical protein